VTASKVAEHYLGQDDDGSGEEHLSGSAALRLS